MTVVHFDEVTAPPLALLDGRFQLIRQLGGPADAPLMIATDLLRGQVVCLRLRPLRGAAATLAAVPRLATSPDADSDGPLLPYDFGVADGLTYVVRDYVTAVRLDQALCSPASLATPSLLATLRRTGEALLVANERGFRHPGLSLGHVLLTATGKVRVAGYDQVSSVRRRSADDATALLALIAAAFAGRSLTATEAPVRSLLVRVAVWRAREAPRLTEVVAHLQRAEHELLGRRRLGAVAQRLFDALRWLVEGLRRLGPLVQPYVFLALLVAAILAAAARSLAGGQAPGRLYVYPTSAAPSAAPARQAPAPPPTIAAPIARITDSVTAVPTANAAENTADPVRAGADAAPPYPMAVQTVTTTRPTLTTRAISAPPPAVPPSRAAPLARRSVVVAPPVVTSRSLETLRRETKLPPAGTANRTTTSTTATTRATESTATLTDVANTNRTNAAKIATSDAANVPTTISVGRPSASVASSAATTTTATLTSLTTQRVVRTAQTQATAVTVQTTRDRASLTTTTAVLRR